MPACNLAATSISPARSPSPSTCQRPPPRSRAEGHPGPAQESGLQTAARKAGGRRDPSRRRLRTPLTAIIGYLELITSEDLPPEDHDPNGPNPHRLRSCGLPGPGVDLRIVDDAGELLLDEFENLLDELHGKGKFKADNLSADKTGAAAASAAPAAQPPPPP